MSKPKLRLIFTTMILCMGMSMTAQTIDDTSIVSKDPDRSRYIDDLFSAYPNPMTDGLVSIELQHSYRGTLAIEVYDVYGRQYYARLVEKYDSILEHDIQSSYWTSGVYIIAITGDGVRSSKRIMKE